MKKLAASLVAFLFVVPLFSESNDLEVRRKMLNDLLKEQWDYSLEADPIYASTINDKRWNDKLSDESIEGIKKDYAKNREFVKRFEAIDTTGFTEQEILNKELMVIDLKDVIEGEKFENYLMPVNQRSGIHLSAPQIVAQLPFTSTKDYDDYITRLKGLPLTFDQTIERMRLGMQKKLMPPRFLLEKVVEQSRDIAKKEVEESPFAEPLKKFSKEISESDQKRIREAMLEAIRTSVFPAYLKFADFVEKEYAPAGRTEVGIWSLPDGDARYARAVRLMTTTSMTPEEIHQLGLKEVARIETEMLVIAKKLGFNDLKSFNASIKENQNLKAKSREQIIELYREHISNMEKLLPQLFGTLPKAKLEVVEVERFREKDAAGAQYQRPAPDGSRPGRVQVNTYKPEERITISVESTAYHEGHPGHHLQIAIQQELPELPPYRQNLYFGAYIEGWALYSEELGKEVGLYKDPYSDYGRLQDEMLRAIRLVVDSGLHFKKWNREQVVNYFREHSAMDEIEIQSETNRYISTPGQAVSYKVGQLKILDLREHAKKELGNRFDIRKFHDQILGAGSVPLTVLEQRIDSWISKQG
jgi:uncharacterized protein (DUF885 family)